MVQQRVANPPSRKRLTGSTPVPSANTRGRSSVGRALAWHARGRRFDPAWLHHFWDVAQWQSVRLLIGWLQVRVLPSQPIVTDSCPAGQIKAQTVFELSGKKPPRNVAQPGSASASGAESRGFESRHSDQFSWSLHLFLFYLESQWRPKNTHGWLNGVGTRLQNEFIPVRFRDRAPLSLYPGAFP